MKIKELIVNLVYAFGAQGLALLMSVLVNLLIPKLLGIEQYSYWQLFVFYSQYIPFLHLGLNDGVYLRYGGISYDQLDKRVLKSQLIVGIIYQIIFSTAMAVCFSIIITDPNRTFVVVAACVYVIVYSFQNYLGYVFQLANETRLFSVSNMVANFSFICAIIVLLFVDTDRFNYFIICYIISFVLSGLFCCVKGRGILKSKMMSAKESLRETRASIVVGSKLMLANIASMFVLGVGRVVIDNFWGIIEFGKVSFSITLTNLVLIFVRQVSMVLFPFLRQEREGQQKIYFQNLRNMLKIILPFAYIFYFVLQLIVSVWLPEYNDSVKYLIVLIPLCVFDGNMQMLYNTYLKVLRKENILLKINVISVLLSVVLCFLGGLSGNILVVVVSMSIAVIFRSVVAEVYLCKIFNLNMINNLMQEIVLTLIFVICAWNLSASLAFMLYSLTYLSYLFVNKKIINDFIEFAFG